MTLFIIVVDLVSGDKRMYNRSSYICKENGYGEIKGKNDSIVIG